jgi:hypothetical protein
MMIATTRQRERKKERDLSTKKNIVRPINRRKNHNILGVTTKIDEIYS